MDKKICTACYERIRKNARYCTHCGEKQYKEMAIGPSIMILTKDQNSVTFPLKNGKSTIGRHVKNSIIVNDENVSTYHAAITVDNKSATIEDLNSRNGVYVNGQKISGCVTLKSGSLIKIGSTILKYTPQHEYQEEVSELPGSPK